MGELRKRLTDWWWNIHSSYRFEVTVPARSRGGYAGAIVVLRRPQGHPQIPSLEQRGGIYQALRAILKDAPVDQEMHIASHSVCQAAHPYEVEGIVAYPLNNWQLMSVSEEVAALPAMARTMLLD